MATQRQNQKLPEETAELLRSLLRDARTAPRGGQGRISPARRAAWRRLAGYIGLLIKADWTMQAVAEALGVRRQAVDSTIRTYPAGPEDVEGLPPAPPAPQKPVPVSPWAPPLPAEVREELTRLRLSSRHISGPVRGTARQDSPEWQASREFAVRVHELVTDGPYTLYSVARDLGVQLNGIRNRLARHGLGRCSPSAVPVRDRGKVSETG